MSFSINEKYYHWMIATATTPEQVDELVAKASKEGFDVSEDAERRKAKLDAS